MSLDTRGAIVAFLQSLVDADNLSGGSAVLSGAQVHDTVARNFTKSPTAQGDYGVRVGTIKGPFLPMPDGGSLAIMGGQAEIICFALVDAADITQGGPAALKAKQIANRVGLAVYHDNTLAGNVQDSTLDADKGITEGPADSLDGQAFMAAIMWINITDAFASLP